MSDYSLFPPASRRHEIVRCDRGLAKTDIGDPEMDRYRLLRIAVGGRRYQHAQLGGLVAAEHDHRPVLRHRVHADDMNGGTDGAVDVDGDDAIEAALVEQAHGVGIAD